MTDTRITVDVSTEALLQRARQQQAQSRQAVIQQEEEKREKARQQREAQKAGRGSVPGQSRLQGRSRAPQTGGKRREVAAGYVQQSDVASGHFSFRAIVDNSSPTTFTYESEHKLWTGNGSKFLEVSYPRNTFNGTAPSSIDPENPYDPPQPQSGSYTWVITLPISVVLPAGGDRLIFVTAYSVATEAVSWYYVLIPIPFTWVLNWTTLISVVTGPTRCYIVSKSNIRQISTPTAVSNWIAGYGYQVVDNDYIYNPLPAGISQGLGSSIVRQGFYPSYYVPINTGTPRTAEAIASANADSWSPKWLQFSQPAANTNTSIPRRITQLTSSTHEPVDLSSGTPVRRLAIQASIPGQSSDPQIQATPLIAWDWDKPDLAKRFLSRIGFTPADLVP